MHVNLSPEIRLRTSGIRFNCTQEWKQVHCDRKHVRRLPRAPTQSPPGPLRMLKNDEVLPFSGACHVFSSRPVSFLLSHTNIPTVSFALLSMLPISSSPFELHFLFSPCSFLFFPFRSTRFQSLLNLLLISLPPTPPKLVLAP